MITIYTIAKCDGCRHAIAFANFKRLEHQVVELESQKDVDDLHARLPKKRNITVPFIMADDEVIGGLREFKQWHSQQSYK